MKCPDCGCTLDNGLCSNCHEEAYIIENQGEFINHPLSDEFIEKADEQFKNRHIVREWRNPID